MTLEALIEIAAARAPLLSEIEAATRALNLSAPEVLDELSRAVATRFVHDRCSFAVADTVMNNLFAFAHVTNDLGMPPLSWSVYQAFDAGEYEHDGDPSELQGENRTRVLLGQIGGLGLPPAPPEDPAWRLAHRARARARAVAVATEVLTGQVSPIVGAQELLRLRASLGVSEYDSDFEVFSVIDSETQSLPFGPVREYWAPESLAAKAGDIHHSEQWALETGGAAFRRVVSRFDGAA
jgi:hypothetical protein